MKIRFFLSLSLGLSFARRGVKFIHLPFLLSPSLSVSSLPHTSNVYCTEKIPFSPLKSTFLELSMNEN